MKTLEFVATIPTEIVVEAFREEFGDFDRAYEGKGEWSGSHVFAWPSHPLYLTVSGDKINPTYHCHFRGRGNEKRVRKVRGVLTSEDLHLVRKVLTSYLDPTREKMNKERFRNNLYVLGLILAAISITFIGVGFFVAALWLQMAGLFLSLIDLIAIGLVWIIYRIGMTDKAVDLRIFAIGFFYTFLVLGVPFSLIAIILGSFLPVQGEMSWLIFPMVLFMLFAYLLGVRILDPILQQKLRQEWSEMRVDAERTTDPETPEQTPLVTNLWAAAFLSYPRALAPSGWIVALTLFSTWAFRILGDNWFWALATLPIFLIWYSISWDIGLDYGFKEAAKRLKETGPYDIKFGEYVVHVNFGIKPDSTSETE